MFKLLFITTFSCIFNLSLFAQKTWRATVKSEQGFYYAPCYDVTIPKIVYTPDSIKLRKEHHFAIFIAACTFDSSGNVLEIVPSYLFLKDKVDGKTLGQYDYWNNESKNVNKKQAEDIADWAVKVLPRLIIILRQCYKCDQKSTNHIYAVTLNYRLE